MKILLLVCALMSNLAFASKETGNGTFAYEQSVKLLKYASTHLINRIQELNIPEINNSVDRKETILNALAYERIVQMPKAGSVYRNGKLLELDYDLATQTIKVYKPYYVAFSGTAIGDDFYNKSVEVETRLIHEVSHLWGFNENEANAFAEQVMTVINDPFFQQDPCKGLVQEMGDEELDVYACSNVEKRALTCVAKMKDWKTNEEYLTVNVINDHDFCVTIHYPGNFYSTSTQRHSKEFNKICNERYETYTEKYKYSGNFPINGTQENKKNYKKSVDNDKMLWLKEFIQKSAVFGKGDRYDYEFVLSKAENKLKFSQMFKHSGVGQHWEKYNGFEMDCVKRK